MTPMRYYRFGKLGCFRAFWNMADVEGWRLSGLFHFCFVCVCFCFVLEIFKGNLNIF